MLAGTTCYRRHFSTRFFKNVVVPKQVNNTVAVLAFFWWAKKAQLPAIQITEQPILPTNSKIKRKRVINFLSIFAKNGQSKLVIVIVLVGKSKGPYSVHCHGSLSTSQTLKITLSRLMSSQETTLIWWLLLNRGMFTVFVISFMVCYICSSADFFFCTTGYAW